MSPPLVVLLLVMQNFVPDPSFETSVPAWLQDGTPFVGKTWVPDAPDGNQVLAVTSWNAADATILSAPFMLASPSDTAGGRLPTTTHDFSATITVRSFGAPTGAMFELVLVSDDGTHDLGSFGTRRLDGAGTFTTMQGTATITTPVLCRLGLRFIGPALRTELDLLALYPAERPEVPFDNAEFHWFDAESIADGAVEVASLLIDGHMAAGDFSYAWDFLSLDVTLAAGQVDITFTRPLEGVAHAVDQRRPDQSDRALARRAPARVAEPRRARPEGAIRRSRPRCGWRSRLLGTRAVHKSHAGRVTAHEVASFLVTDARFPRSVTYSLHAAYERFCFLRRRPTSGCPAARRGCSSRASISGSRASPRTSRTCAGS